MDSVVVLGKLRKLQTIVENKYRENVLSDKRDSAVEMACARVGYWISDLESEATRYRMIRSRFIEANEYYKRYK